MRTGIILAVIATLSIATASDAQADGWFFSEGFGTSEVGGELGEVMDGTANVRIALGRRFGKWAIEGFMMANMMDGQAGLLEGGFHAATGYGLSARYMFPVSERTELYLRGGLHKIRMDIEVNDPWADDEFSGRAFHFGAGAMIKGKVPVLGLLALPLLFTNYGPKMTGALWVEANQQFTRLHNINYDSIDASISSLTVGFSVGSDF